MLRHDLPEPKNCPRLATLSFSPTRLVSPFETRPSSHEGSDGYEISDGNVAVWVRGEHFANRLARLMTLAERCGEL